MQLGRWKNVRAPSNGFVPSRTSSGASWWPNRPSHSTSTRTSARPARTTGGRDRVSPSSSSTAAGGTSLIWTRYVEHLGGRAALRDRHDRRRRMERAERAAVTGADDLEPVARRGTGRRRRPSGAHLVGISYGGFLALNQAARAARASLFVSRSMDPAGLAPHPARLASLRWGMSVRWLASKLPSFTARRRTPTLRMPTIEDPRIMGMVR